MFGDLRKYINLIMSFTRINADIDTAEGLRAYMQWAIDAGRMFGIAESFLEVIEKALTNETVFNIILAAIRFVNSQLPEGKFAAAGLPGEGMAETVSVMMENGEQEFDAAELNKWLPFAAQLQAFVNETKMRFTVTL